MAEALRRPGRVSLRLSHVVAGGVLTAMVLSLSPPASAQVMASLAGAAGTAVPGVGGSIQDTVILSDGAAPSGAIVFVIYGPDGLPRQPRTVTVQGNGTYSSGSYVPDAAGVWRFIAKYTGDGVNGPASTSPDDPAQAVVVTKASPALTVVALPAGPGAQLGAVATLAGGALAGGVVPTGTITFSLYPPGDIECAGAPVWQSSATVFDNGAYPSSGTVVASPGVYRWSATYSGDGNNQPARSPCGGPAAVVEVKYASPESKDDCKRDGWKTLTDAFGRSLRNQGQCVVSVASPSSANSS